MKKIYLNHSSTTPVDPRVVERMTHVLTEYFGNPSDHIIEPGIKAAGVVDEARAQVAKLVGAKPDEIYFTSGATESNNLAVSGFLKALPEAGGRHMVISEIEHFSILNQGYRLARQGYDVTFLQVDQFGRVQPDTLKSAVRDDTVLVSVMTANSEIGSIQPIAELAALCRERGIYFHTDAAAAAGTIPVNAPDLDVDSMTLSAHNFYGPKGVGALYVRDGVRIAPLFEGGFQEGGLRPGTENVAGIAGMGMAAAIALEEMEQRNAELSRLGRRLRKGIEESISYLHFTGHPKQRLPGHVSFWVEYIEGESLLLMLNIQGIMASSGSACSSNLKGQDEDDLAASHVLTAVGVPPEFCSGSLTFSLGKDNTDEDVDRVLEILPGIVERLLAMSPLYADRMKQENA